MRIDAERLATDSLRLEFPQPEPQRPNVIVFGPSRGVTGTYAHDDRRFALKAIRGEELGFRHVEWGVGEGRVTVEGPTTLASAFVDAEIPRNEESKRLIGTINFARGTLGRVSVELAGIAFVGELEVHGFKFSPAATGGILVTAEKIVATDAAIRKGAIFAEVARLEVRHAQLWLVGEKRSFECRGIEGDDAVVLLEGGVRVELDDVRLSRGLRFADGRLEIANLTVGAGTVDVQDLGAMLPSNEGAEEGEVTPPEEAPRRGTAPFDLSFLDGLHGKLDVDLVADTTLPVIGRRKKTHRFRVPIRGGEINYRQLERDLATLEDAFIDLKVRDGKLSLENDIPLLPFYHRSLLLFRLEPEEVERAKNEKMVKLQRFAEWELPEKKSGEERSKKRSKDKQPVELQGLDFEHVAMEARLETAAELDFGERGTLRLGAKDVPSLEALSIRGDLRHRPSDAPPEPGELRMTLEGLRAGIDEVPIAGRTLWIEGFVLERVEPARLHFLGLRPRALHVSLQGLTVYRFVI